MRSIRISVWILLSFVIPGVLMLLLQYTVTPVLDKISEQSEYSEATEGKRDEYISVLCKDGEVVLMPIEQYVVSVVLKEMPASFEIEALKAQAVVARTYALKRMEKRMKHADAAVCKKSSCCQGFCDIEEYLQNGGKDVAVEKVREAVEATSGMVLVYEGELIDATYFSCSGGATEDASAVWGTDVPYLQSVVSPGEEDAKYFVDTVKVSALQFAKSLNLQLDRQGKIVIGKITYTDGGGVDVVEICGENFSGTQLRKALGLRSTAFIITAVGDSVTITTKGFGHRVGMSQYGADAMAVNHASFSEILLHYYQGTQIISYTVD